MPFPNEHSARLISPGSLKPIRVRRTKGSGKARVKGVIVPKNISVIWFIIRREGKEVPVAQALRFPIKDWTVERARKWVKDNKIKPILFEPAEPKKKSVQKILDIHKRIHEFDKLTDTELEEVGMEREGIISAHDDIVEKMIEKKLSHASVLISKSAITDIEDLEGYELLLEEDELEEPEEDDDSEKESVDFNIDVEFAKVDNEEQMVYGVVLEPKSIDAQDDSVKIAEVRKAAHRYMERVQKLGINHEDFKNIKKRLRIMESYLAPVDFTLGGQNVVKGSWVFATRVLDKKIWEKVKKGEITGFSLGGKGKRTKISM
jgi:hypothetical protein